MLRIELHNLFRFAFYNVIAFSNKHVDNGLILDISSINL